MNAVYTVPKNQNSDEPIVYIDLKISHARQAVPENCSAITEAILHEVSSGERDN